MHLPWTGKPTEKPDASPVPVEAADGLVVYGTSWCGDCARTRRFLDRHQVTYHWIDLDEHPEDVERVRTINHGHRSVPTIVFPDGSTLTEPADTELGRKLGIER